MTFLISQNTPPRYPTPLPTSAVMPALLHSYAVPLSLLWGAWYCWIHWGEEWRKNKNCDSTACLELLMRSTVSLCWCWEENRGDARWNDDVTFFVTDNAARFVLLVYPPFSMECVVLSSWTAQRTSPTLCSTFQSRVIFCVRRHLDIFPSPSFLMYASSSEIGVSLIWLA